MTWGLQASGAGQTVPGQSFLRGVDLVDQLLWATVQGLGSSLL